MPRPVRASMRCGRSLCMVGSAPPMYTPLAPEFLTKSTTSSIDFVLEGWRICTHMYHDNFDH
ncbi:MAG: hypothetical protein MIO93_04320 [ANME-2 cluster archaeon]|nr:hypothetical protein [ANME-2 cluster archaeon]